jgi:peptidoglycan/xylan/chitin deacetylase (PgdA/CDA1 family)
MPVFRGLTTLLVAVLLTSCSELPTARVGQSIASSTVGELPDELIGTEWSLLPTGAKVVALTFDCGANADGVPAILRTLNRKGVPATFFLTGKWSLTFERKATRMASSYGIGNHTFDHPDLTTLPRKEVRRQIRQATRAIIDITGVDPHPLFRFPYGASDAETLRIVNRRGFGSFRWTVDTLGWKGTKAGITRRSVIRRVMEALQPGAIVLMHVGSAPDGSTLDADALPTLIRKIRKAGYRFVRLDRFVSKLG